MPDSNLLNIDPDVLFQQHAIGEIDEIQKKLLHEIERKKEELRVMVGERYRDLIEAADTIGDMKTTASNCIKHIDDMTTTCRTLHDTHLIGFKNDSLHSSIERPIVNRTVHGIAVQIKLLMAIPEQIWGSVDVEDYLTATQLFLFARHIYTGLQLETGGQNVNKNILALMPVVHRQWNSLSNFNESLIQSCQNKLGNPDLKAEVAASCLASLYLLNRNKSLVDLMNTFITLHSTDSLTKILSKNVDTSISQGNFRDDIIERIASCVRVIVKTLHLLYSCFVENKNGLILQRLNDLYDKKSPPLISLVQFHDPIGLKLLPPVVMDFRLSPFAPLNAVTKDELSQCVSVWMKWVENISSDRVQKLLQYINNAKLLHLIREEAISVETPANWDEICITLSIDRHNSNIWSSNFQPFITKRLKNIISTKWKDIIKNLKVNIKKLIENITKPNSAEKEMNLNWFVWNDLIAQSFISTEDDILSSVNALMKGMSMQDRGFTPNLEKICENFDQSLNALLEDLRIYLYEKINENDNKNSFYDENILKMDNNKQINASNEFKYLDRSDIENYIRNCSAENIHSFIKYIHEECIGKSLNDNDEVDVMFKSSSILSARLLQAIPVLVPNLRTCFIPIQTNSVYYEEFNIPNATVTQSWDEICNILNDNCHKCWLNWIENALKRVDESLKGLPQEFTLAANMDYLLIQWDAITIEEKDDQDQPVSSTIKIPSGPSIKLQQFLYSAARILDEIIPHTLPKTIHISFIESVANKALQHYSRVIKDKSDEINQKCALQLLMDIRHITLLLVTRENKSLMTESHDVCNLLREKIDPFDYDVFYPRLQINVRRSVQRVQILLGSLIPNYDQLNSIIGPKPLVSGGTADRDPNAYILASQGNASGTWFPLLPVTTPMSANRKQAEKQRKKQVQTTSPTFQKISSYQDSTTSIPSGTSASNSVRSSAAAFFGSMTSDWFGN